MTKNSFVAEVTFNEDSQWSQTISEKKEQDHHQLEDDLEGNGKINFYMLIPKNATFNYLIDN